MAFEQQFIRFLEELHKLYPREVQLRQWLTALRVKQALLPEATRDELFHSFAEYISEPLGSFIERHDEEGLLRRMGELAGALDGDDALWFRHFHALYLAETDREIKDTMWQYVDSLHQLIGLA